jgi:hypothetical protein
VRLKAWMFELANMGAIFVVRFLGKTIGNYMQCELNAEVHLEKKELDRKDLKERAPIFPWLRENLCIRDGSLPLVKKIKGNPSK